MWKAILRALGLSNEARVRISAPGIDVVVTGDPEKVRAMLSTVRQALEKDPRMLTRGRGRPKHRRRTMHPMPASDSQVVRPTELDEMDSPYALPEAVVMPVPDEDVTDERAAPRAPTSRRRAPREADTLDTDQPAPFGEVPSEETVSGLATETAVPVDLVEDESEAAATALAPNPSGGMRAVSRPAGTLSTDGGPTLMPSDSHNDVFPGGRSPKG